MKETITESRFVDAFDECNRSENFTREGRKALYDYLNELEESTGEEIELDVIAFCCEFTEYANIQDFQEDYDDSYEAIEDIERGTIVIPIDDDSFIIQNF